MAKQIYSNYWENNRYTKNPDTIWTKRCRELGFESAFKVEDKVLLFLYNLNEFDCGKNKLKIYDLKSKNLINELNIIFPDRKDTIDDWLINEKALVWTNNALYFGGMAHFSKTSENQIINICNQDSPQYSYFETKEGPCGGGNLYDALFNGNLYQAWLNKDKTRIEFESNDSDRINVKYDFLEDKFWVSIVDDVKSDDAIKSSQERFDYLKKLSQIEKRICITS